MEAEGIYSFSIAVVGPNDELNSKFMKLIAETHGHVDGVEFHQSTIEKVAALIYWQPHEDSMSPILVSHSLKNANGAIIIMAKDNQRILNRYDKLIKENAGEIPVKKVIFEKEMGLEEIGDLAFNSVKDLAAQLIIEAEQKSKKLRKKMNSMSGKSDVEAGEPQFYVDKLGMISKFKTKDSIPLYQDQRYLILKKDWQQMRNELLDASKKKENLEKKNKIEKEIALEIKEKVEEVIKKEEKEVEAIEKKVEAKKPKIKKTKKENKHPKN